MILIEDKIVGDEIFSQQFECNLSLCKGRCCVEGACGAPLEKEEKVEIEKAFSTIQHLLSDDAKKVINEKGFYENNPQHGLVTPTVGDGICVYGFIQNGKVLCAFEQSFREKKIAWKKPISCHLFPIRITHTDTHELLNYEELNICSTACLEKKVKTPLYKFLKEALIRKYGQDFYNAMEQIDLEYSLSKE